jgi:diguanylate cyclase (GGDEF)-like protein
MYDQDENPLGILGVTRDITEWKKVEISLQAYAHQQTLLKEITQAAIQQNDLFEMLQILADRLGELLNADGCYITLWDDDNQQTLPIAAHGPMRKQYNKISIPDPSVPTFTQKVLATGQHLIVPDVRKSPFIDQSLIQRFSEQSALVLPLIANDKKLGASIITFNSDHVFDQDEIERGLQAAQQIALAILKARLFDEAEQRAREAETLRSASAAIAATLVQDQAIERILEELNRVVPYDSASVLLRKGTEMQIVGTRGFENQADILGMRFAIRSDTPNRVVFETRQPYILENAPDKFPAFCEPPHDHIHGWMGIPLLIHEKLIGMLTLDSYTPNQFNQDHARLASAFAGQVAIALENTRLFEETRRLAITDSLTSLYNRRHFMELARREFVRSKRYLTPLSIIMLDLDHFKKINDTHGHLLGDQVLQTVATICVRNLRSIDIIGRYGGEEFVILLPETPLTRPANNTLDTNELKPLPAQVVAERLRKTFARQELELNGITINLTISLGIAELLNSDKSIENVIDHADRALLQAKKQGRNRVITWYAEENIE